mmetsp:Transcript_7845/g.11341  ORF Transcript_7845/g.11341 Transcript_7845/m.11341 type:complete len:199 (-) Transcript_7845:697-1293(-)|eukprot:CAMPEP_0202456746 /NCGR_PEP_ID=MMETSP1360-20130828/13924_1 /ASSEMBLY_ACC=CAM_ASM_000848 /TAXON_ID=515479 /ORGANISM="Licmophora paradoxa, Strain CCMP2313" /LENGTH=198 /DNA_ID=CAMNT_0049076641 /DNA_START=941 /DNA_END=1537 /DNA_ORIENTATION=+
MAPPPVVVPSTTGVNAYKSVVATNMVGRVVPGMGDRTMPLMGGAHGDYQTQLQYQGGQFEPTPIAPNQPLRIRSSRSRSVSPKRPQLERSGSLELDRVFGEDGETSKDAKKSMHGSSQHMSAMSAMSFSIGDMSALFEELPDKVKSTTLVDKKLDMSVTTFPEDELGESIMNMSISKGFHDSVDSSDSLAQPKKTESV